MGTKAANSWLHLSSFLTMYGWMPELAKQYCENVQFAFKPHPILYTTLCKQWGKQRTDEYYTLWAEMPNTQLCEGEYLGLFKHSDAMIHDCASFIVEYLYTNNPVLYTSGGGNEQFNKFALMCLDQFYHGHSQDEVRDFIENVINDIDPKATSRKAFVSEHLLTRNGKTACDNIIDVILKGSF